MARLKRTLNLFDATALAIGAIIGAGIFVISGVAAGLAGPAVILAIMLAGTVASFTAFSYAKLASRHPQEGGSYVFAKREVSHFAGFMTGWIWLFANVVAGATVSLGLASYVVALFHQLPLVPVAISSILLLTLLNVVGIKQSSIFNAVLVLLKLCALALFVIVGFSHINLALYGHFAPDGIKGILGATALIFFAYTGFGTPAAAAGEIKDPRHNVPRSITLALVLSSVVYVLVGVVAVGIIPYQKLADSGSPLTDVVDYGIKAYWLKLFVSFAAIVATVSVLLTTIIGVSRVSYAMGKDGVLPRLFGKTHKKFSTPYLGIIVIGVTMAVLPMFGDLRQTANVTNFGSLSAYGMVNLSAILMIKKGRMRGAKHLAHVVIPVLGLGSCILLLCFLSIYSWIIGVSWTAAGLLYYYIIPRHFKEKA
ncbi:MAG: amino acid permease [Thaumarchaeota archaeon]|nr:amino acid permease [Nitrososphaerota archaeon]